MGSKRWPDNLINTRRSRDIASIWSAVDSALFRMYMYFMKCALGLNK